nr:MAG TPA: hypothetical protein [Caudoviricetes sp.]
MIHYIPIVVYFTVTESDRKRGNYVTYYKRSQDWYGSC